jgi:anti-sigma regulatory factor (Ser/Thr protein kinase)
MTDTIRATLPRDPSCGSFARHLLQDRLADRLEPTVLGDAQTVLAELVNNAYLHGTGTIELQLQLLSGRLRIEVIDQGQGAAVQVRERGAEGGGHGLRVVQSLSTAWGVFEGTTHVWAELETAREDPSQLPV